MCGRALRLWVVFFETLTNSLIEWYDSPLAFRLTYLSQTGQPSQIKMKCTNSWHWIAQYAKDPTSKVAQNCSAYSSKQGMLIVVGVWKQTAHSIILKRKVSLGILYEVINIQSWNIFSLDFFCTSKIWLYSRQLYQNHQLFIHPLPV